MAIVYKITNLINLKAYIGATSTDLGKRMYMHKFSAFTMQTKSEFYSAIREFGWSNFAISEIENCKEKDLFKREEYWIKKLDTMWPNGYNTESSHLKGGFQAEIVKQKKSLAQKERFKIKAERKRHSVRMKTMFMNPEYKENHRQGLINSWTPERREEYRQKALKNKAFYESRNDEAIRRALAKKVHVYNIETKKIKTFATMTEAAKDIGSAPSAITQSIKRKSVLFNKFIIKKASDPISFEELFHQIEQKKIQEFMNDSAIRTGRAAWNKKQIKLTNVKTGEAKLFESLKSAASYLKRQTTNISHACAKEGRIVADHYAEYV